MPDIFNYVAETQSYESTAGAAAEWGQYLAISDTQLFVGSQYIPATASETQGGIQTLSIPSLSHVNTLRAPEATGFLLQADMGPPLAANNARVYGGHPNASAEGNSLAGLMRIFSGGSLEASLTEPTPQTNSQFGHAVATNGTHVVIGTGNAISGANQAYLYEADGTFISELVPSDAVEPFSFGATVAMNDSYVYVGAHWHDGDDGALYVFDLSGTEVAKVIPPELVGAGDAFGCNIAANNNVVVVSSYYGYGFAPNNFQPVYLFTPTGAYITRIEVGDADEGSGEYTYLAANENYFVAAYSFPTALYPGGFVQVFDNAGVVIQTLNGRDYFPEEAGPSGDYGFGAAVAINDSHLAVYRHASNTTPHLNRVYLFGDSNAEGPTGFWTRLTFSEETI